MDILVIVCDGIKAVINSLFNLAKNFCKGMNYCFLKEPSIKKYLGLILSIIIAVVFMVISAKKLGIIALIAGILIPVIYISFYSSHLDDYRIIKERDELPDSEKELFFQELMKDEEFKNDVYQGFVEDMERKKKKKELILEIKKLDTPRNDDFLFKNYKNIDSRVKGDDL